LSMLGACIIPIHDLMPISDKLSILKLFDTHIIIIEPEHCKDLKIELNSNEYQCTLGTLQNNHESDFSINERTPEFKAKEYSNIAPQPDDALFALSSSGTSGNPKFVEVTQRNTVNVIKATKYFMEPVDNFKNNWKIMCAFPLSTSALLTLISQIFYGITILLCDDLSPIRFLTLIEQYNIDIIAATPAYYETLINLPAIGRFNLESVKRIYSGMDFLSNKRLQKIRNYFKNAKRAGIGYGLAETSAVIMVWKAGTEEDYYLSTSTMTPIPNIDNEIDIRNSKRESCGIHEQGEIVARGPNVVKGYYRNPNETNKSFENDGWFHTGDLGYRDNEGRIRLLGRLKYIIKRGGRTISPIQIRDHLHKHSAIANNVVVGVPHTMFGEMIWAFIKTEKNRNITEGDVMKYCREGLPPYAIPDYIYFLNEIPKKPGIGKINYEELIKIALHELENVRRYK